MTDIAGVIGHWEPNSNGRAAHDIAKDFEPANKTQTVCENLAAHATQGDLQAQIQLNTLFHALQSAANSFAISPTRPGHSKSAPK